MAEDSDRQAAQEQLERRRLERLVDALPVFSGFASPDGHLIQTRPETSETFIWALPAFAYSHDSVTQIVDLCEHAANGTRVQIERPYLKLSGPDGDEFGRGLLTLTPIEEDNEMVGELAVTLIDCDDNGMALPDPMAKTRLANANGRIASMLSLAHTVIEATLRSQSDMPESIRIGADGLRDRLSSRLDALASIIDVISDPDLEDMPVANLVGSSIGGLPDEVRDHLRIGALEGAIPIASTPLVALLLSELLDNAQRYGALRERRNGARGRVSIQSEIGDDRRGRTLRIHWIEDGGPNVPAVLVRGFGLTLAEKLFPQITGGTTHLLNTEEGLNWTFELPAGASYDEEDGQFGFLE